MAIQDIMPNCEYYAQSILNAVYRDGIVYPINVETVADKLGLKVHYKALPDHISGFFAAEDNAFGIVVNSNHHTNRQRFTLAHEIGHYVSYKMQNKSDDIIEPRDVIASQGTNPEEVFANKFAAALLMPMDELRNKSVESDSALSAYFMVSESAIKFRRKNI